MPEQKKPEQKPAPSVKPELARASESTDPAVHQLLAELNTANANGNSAAAETLRSQLADLGYA